MVLNQFNKAAQIELKAWKSFLALSFLCSCFVIFSQFARTGDKFKYSLSLLACNLVACHFTMAIIFMYIHFQNDLSWLIGNMQHHSDITQFTEKSNASVVDTLPNGFFACYLLNLAWLIIGFNYLSPKFTLLREWASAKFNIALFMVSGLISAFMLKDDHPHFHAVATEEMKDAVPFSFEYRAYNHVFVHHVDGDSFGSSFIFDPMFSKAFTLLAYVHSDVFGLTSATSAPHYAVIFVFDILQSFTVMAILIAMFTWSAKMVKVLNTDSGTSAKAGALVWCGASAAFWLFANGFVMKPKLGAGDEL